MPLEMQGLTKAYGSTTVLRGVDLRVEPGEVHALLGPNGAGKSTLIKCVAGAIAPTAGTIQLSGQPLSHLTPSGATELGIAVIHQHLSLIDVLSVVDNIFLGQELRRGPLISKRKQRAEARALLERFDIRVDIEAPVGTLPIGTKQLIEIAKAWHQADVQVLILDEPTASLSESETKRLFEEVTRMRELGTRIIYTTHRLAEVFRIARRVTVLRDGAVTLQEAVSDLTPRDLVAAISAGYEASDRQRPDAGGTLAVVDELAGPHFGPVSFEVRSGEILGLYGVLGSGRTSLLETIAGRFAADHGSVWIAGSEISIRSPAAAVRSGIALVPSDRQRQALWGSRSAADNVLLPSFGDLASRGVRRPTSERRVFEETSSAMELRPANPNLKAAMFSGGNQQKMVLGRWLARASELSLLLLDEPTQGVDVGARQKIYDVCRELAGQGVAVLFASTDAEEVAALADRALVIDEGRVVHELTGSALTEDELLINAHQFTGTSA